MLDGTGEGRTPDAGQPKGHIGGRSWWLGGVEGKVDPYLTESWGWEDSSLKWLVLGVAK